MHFLWMLSVVPRCFIINDPFWPDLQVQSVVPDQLLLQMLVSWLGPITKEKEDVLKAKEKRKPAVKSCREVEKPGAEQEPQRPPLKVAQHSLQLLQLKDCPAYGNCQDIKVKAPLLADP